MKINKWIDISQEVEIDLCIEDIKLLWAECRDKSYEVSCNITYIYQYLSSLPDESINTLSPKARELINEKLIEQAKRFTLQGTGEIVNKQ